MIKTKPVRVCDDCERTLATTKCEVCNCDLCENCEETFEDDLFENQELFGDEGYICCKKCVEIVREFVATKKFWKEVLIESKLKKVIQRKLMDRVMLKNLKSDKTDKDDKDDNNW